MQQLDVRAADLRTLGVAILVHEGAIGASAELVADHLVTAHLMGLDSHGAIRFLQYVRDIRNGRIDPRAEPVVLTSTASAGVVDGLAGFGQVTATVAADLAIEKARTNGVAAVTTRRCNHVGRLGAYAERCAREGIVALVVAAIPKVGHFVLPSGGADGRLGTNPLAFGFPTSRDPIVADFATSVIPEGRARTARNKGTLLPEGAVVDALGRPTRDPEAFYGPPMGSLLPIGGPVAHKGYALSLMVELLGATLLGDLAQDGDRSINGLTIVAIDAGAFAPDDRVAAAADALVTYMRSSTSIDAAAPVMLPGEPEFATLRAAGPEPTLSIDEETWRQITEIAQADGVAVPPATPAGLIA